MSLRASEEKPEGIYYRATIKHFTVQSRKIISSFPTVGFTCCAHLLILAGSVSVKITTAARKSTTGGDSGGTGEGS